MSTSLALLKKRTKERRPRRKLRHERPALENVLDQVTKDKRFAHESRRKQPCFAHKARPHSAQNETQDTHIFFSIFVDFGQRQTSFWQETL
jgi:hypothetical protein